MSSAFTLQNDFPRAPDESSPPALRILPAALPRPIRGVLFDMCNVLYDDTVWRRWLLRLITQFGVQTTYRGFFHVWNRDHLEAVHRGRQSFGAALDTFLASVGLSRGQIEEVQAASQAQRRQIEETLRPLPCVRSTLARIVQRNYILGAICNSELPASGLHDRLKRFDMTPWFTTAVSSIDLGHTMPDAEGYCAALKAMGLSAEQTAFVGHDAGELAGAAALGMVTVAFNYDPDAQADVYLGRFEELEAVLASTPTLLAVAG